LNDNDLTAVKEAINFFKKTTQSWGFLIILASFPIFYASQPGVWEYLHSALVNNGNKITTAPETSIPILIAAWFVLLVGLCFAIIGTMEKSKKVNAETHEELREALSKQGVERDNAGIQRLFNSLFKYEPSVVLIELIYKSINVAGASFYYKAGQEYIQEIVDGIKVDIEYIVKRKRFLSNFYWLIIAVMFILLLAKFWLPHIVEDKNINDLMYWVIGGYLMLMVAVGFIISEIKKISSAKHFYKILENSKQNLVSNSINEIRIKY